jgi:predicted nucleic acid-binding protein
MACLLDTGVLLRAFDASSAEYRPIRQTLRTLWMRQEQLVVAVQNLAEFWNVSTRPVDKNGYGLSLDRAAKRLALVERFCDVISEDDNSYQVWKGLLTAHAIAGVAVHDARLVSVMLARGISSVFTLNERDFRRYSGIVVVTPGQL